MSNQDGASLTDRFIKGEKDLTGDVITEIFVRSPEFVIYSVVDSLVCHATLDEQVESRSDILRPMISDIRALMPADGMDRVSQHHIVNALSLAFRGEPEAAIRVLDRLRHRLTKSRRAGGQLRYLGTAAIAVAAVLICAGLSTILPTTMSSSIAEFIPVAVFGALGALLSVSVGLRAISIDVDDPPLMMAALGATRIMIGMVGALGLYSLVQANLVLGLFAESGTSGLRALAFLAGFSETLVPNVLTKVEEGSE